jgi:hypothetical protein
MHRLWGDGLPLSSTVNKKMAGGVRRRREGAESRPRLQRERKGYSFGRDRMSRYFQIRTGTLNNSSDGTPTFKMNGPKAPKNSGQFTTDLSGNR